MDGTLARIRPIHDIVVICAALYVFAAPYLAYELGGSTLPAVSAFWAGIVVLAFCAHYADYAGGFARFLARAAVAIASAFGAIGGMVALFLLPVGFGILAASGGMSLVDSRFDMSDLLFFYLIPGVAVFYLGFFRWGPMLSRH